MYKRQTLDWYQESFNQDFKSYLQYLRDSVEILCTNYGEIGGPVSYTHLDVYKRQGGGQPGAALLLCSSGPYRSMAVYDVY